MALCFLEHRNHGEETKGEVDIQYIMYRWSMTRSCGPVVLLSFGHTHQVAFEFWPIFGSRGASALRLA